MLMYADDTVLFYFGKVAATIEKSLKEDLDLIGSWLYDNSLFLNALKTEAMLFGTHARLSDADFAGVTFKGRPIMRVFEFRYLGVVFDEHISWNSHVKYVLSRAGKRLGMRGHIRGNLLQTMPIPFTQLIFILSWIIVTPCGTAAELATVYHKRGLKDVPLKLFQK